MKLHKGCGGAVVPGPDSEALVCADCQVNINLDSQIEEKRIKAVRVTARPNIAPAGTVITREAEGSSLSVAITRAVSAVMKDKKIKGKRIIFPMHFTVTERGF